MNELATFVKVCCESPEKIFPWKDVLADARRLLKLHDKNKLFAFICNDGLEKPSVVNKPFFIGKNGNKTKYRIHAYKFSSHKTQMYLAFFYNDDIEKWNLKSFHEPNDPEPTLRNQLAQAIMQKQLEDNS